MRRRVWRGSIPGRWARWPTARSRSACTRSPSRSAPLDWRLFLPERWDDTLAADAGGADRRPARSCAIPEQVRHIPKWRLALEMLDELADWGHVPPLVVGDAGYGDNTSFRLGLSERGMAYVVAVKATTSAYPGEAVPRAAYGGRGRPPRPATPERLQPARPGIGRRRRSLRQVTWRQGSKKTRGNPTAKMRRVSPRSGSAPPTATSPGPATAACPNAGCWPNGHPAKPNPPTTGCPPFPPTPPSRHSSAWRRSAGGSNTTTAN